MPGFTNNSKQFLNLSNPDSTTTCGAGDMYSRPQGYRLWRSEKAGERQYFFVEPVRPPADRRRIGMAKMNLLNCMNGTAEISRNIFPPNLSKFMIEIWRPPKHIFRQWIPVLK